MSRTLPRSFIAIFPLLCAAAPIDEATRARYAALAAEQRDSARNVRDVDAGIAGDFARLGAFMTDDLVLLKEATEAHATAYEKVAAAYERGDIEEIRRLGPIQEKALQARIVLRERILEWRNKQFLAAPTEQWFTEFTRWYHAGAAELLAWAEARKAAAEAWGRVADACVPGRDGDAFEALKDEAYTLDTEREIAEMRFTFVRDRAMVMANQNPKYPATSPELTRSIEQLTKLQEQRLAAKRVEAQREREERKLDRAIHKADKAFRAAYESALRDANERARNAKK